MLWRRANAFTPTERRVVQVPSKPSARFLSGGVVRLVTTDRGLLLQIRVPLRKGTPQPTASTPCFSHHRRGNDASRLLVDGKLFENLWEGSDWSCNSINPKHKLKIQKLLMCLFFTARDEVRLLTDTRAQVPQLAPKLLFSCSW